MGPEERGDRGWGQKRGEKGQGRRQGGKRHGWEADWSTLYTWGGLVPYALLLNAGFT